ncbi:MAG: ABC transporter ATP-binding protein [Oligoflexales bacterium]|nr:ABC transporter ATP-binding protein [Oligoflexales bacterium]
MLLKTINLGMHFGGLRAVDNFNLNIRSGEIVGLIGPNGAGKTTVFNMLTGIYEPTLGEIWFESGRIDGKAPHLINRQGIARTFQNIRLFRSLSVLDNVRAALHKQVDYTLISSVLRLKSFYNTEQKIIKRSIDLLKLFELDGRLEQQADSLPYGEQRKLEIVRAMATGPRLLLLDEPAAGMNPQETQNLIQLTRKLRDEFGVTILLIEHDMNLVMSICERIYVLDYGRQIAHGTPSEIQSNHDVIKAYLGEA